MLEESGPEALQARKVTAEVGVSTQVIYTLFGGMPGLFEAVGTEGFVRLAQHVAAVPETDDPVADHFAKGWAYGEWALTHPQLYRLMFGLTGADLRARRGPKTLLLGAMADPKRQVALDVLVRSINRITESGRIRPIDPLVAAGQFLSATHGYLLLEIVGALSESDSPQIMGELAINLMVGLGDSRQDAERSFMTTLASVVTQTSTDQADAD